MEQKKQIAILGSTGSIGTQALEVIEEHADLYEVYCLTANNKVELLAEQAHKFKPAAIVIANEARYDALKALMSDMPDVKVYAGAKALDEIVEAGPIDMVLTAMVGFSGLNPTIHAIKAGKTICLANPIEKILLTASGGPFRLKSMEEIAHVTKADALRHPTWDMGAKITIDSASMMNKGFEVIEAKWLFGVDAKQIQVLVHPQSIVHSAVQFQDGSVKAQLGVPDMRLPIQYAFSFPQRLHLSGERLDLFKAQHLEFFEPDLKKFRCLALAFEAIDKGGNMPCIVNAANEIVNRGFLEDKCGFLQMGDIIAETMQRATFDKNPSYDTYIATDAEARRIASELMKR